MASINVIEVRYQGNRSVHQWVKLNPNEVNVFENGFLAEFKLAQQNLIAYKTANPNCGQPMNPPCSFANNGLPGQSPLPILTAAFTNPGGLDPAGFSNGAFLSDLKNGQAGDFASSMAGSSTYLCNLVGSASFSPCALNGVANPGHGYPINFFQANPYNAGKATGYLTDPACVKATGPPCLMPGMSSMSMARTTCPLARVRPWPTAEERSTGSWEAGVLGRF